MTEKPTYPAHIPAMLFVKEIVAKPNEKGEETLETAYATWLVGVEKNGVLYARQVSADNLLKEHEILHVHAGHCTPYELPTEYQAFKGYAFETEPDQLPQACYQLHITTFDCLDKDIQQAIMEAFELFETVSPPMQISA